MKIIHIQTGSRIFISMGYWLFYVKIFKKFSKFSDKKGVQPWITPPLQSASDTQSFTCICFCVFPYSSIPIVVKRQTGRLFHEIFLNHCNIFHCHHNCSCVVIKVMRTCFYKIIHIITGKLSKIIFGF